MKKIVFGVITVLIIFALSCRKEYINPVDDKSNSNSIIDFSQISLKEKGFTGKNGSKKLLVFKDMKSFKSVVSALQNQISEQKIS